MNEVKNAVQNGTIVLVENISETIDPVLNPILARATFNRNGKMYINLGEDSVEYNNNFKIYF